MPVFLRLHVLSQNKIFLLSQRCIQLERLSSSDKSPLLQCLRESLQADTRVVVLGMFQTFYFYKRRIIVMISVSFCPSELEHISRVPPPEYLVPHNHGRRQVYTCFERIS
jgi:hypothetical protein